MFHAYRTDPSHRDVFGAAGITQDQLGSWFGLSQAQVSRIESGQQPCRQLDSLIEWAQILGIPQELLWFDLPGADDADSENRFSPDSLPSRPTLLKQLLQSRHLLPYRRFRQEYDKVAKQVDKQLVGTCPSDRMYYRWISGRIISQPRSECCAILEAMFPGYTVAELLAQPKPDTRPASVPAPVAVASRSPCLLSEAPQVAAVRAMAQAFRSADRQLGGGVMYGQVVRYLRAEVAPCLVDPSGRTGMALFTAASSMTDLAGWMAHDSGQDAVARQHFDRAYRLAQAADDTVLTSHACASMAHLAGQSGHFAEAVGVAERGLVSAPKATALVPRLHAMRARGLAMRKESTSCVAALRDAELALSGVGGAYEWMSAFDEASLASESASCLHAIGDLTGAEEQARIVLELRDTDRVRARAFAQLTLASIALHSNRIDEAAELGTSVCEVALSLTSRRVRARLDRLGTMLGKHATQPAVAAFLQRWSAKDTDDTWTA